MTFSIGESPEDRGVAPDRESGQSWRAVFKALEAEIRGGRYSAGERLPSEQEVAACFGVSRTTVRRAFLGLSQEGLIRIVNGSGSFATIRHHTYTVDSNSRFRDTLERCGLRVSHRCLSAETAAADEAMAKMLEVPEGTRVTCLVSVMSADGVPVVLSRRIYPYAVCPQLVELYPSELSVTRVFERFGLGELERVETSVSARLPSDEEAGFLEMAPNAAVLQINSRGAVARHGIVEYNCSITPGSGLMLNFKT